LRAERSIGGMISGSHLSSAAQCDVCIVGAGPLGLTMALECAELGLSVALLEAGGLSESPEQLEASRAEIVDPLRQAPMELATRRMLGGASWLWGGRCVPFDPIDYETRTFVKGSGWPIGWADIEPWYAKACFYLGCGEPVFSARSDQLARLAGDVRADRLERWASEPRLARHEALRGRVERSPSIHLYLDCVVNDLEVSAEGAVTALARTGAETVRITPPTLVLAMGGLETTRVLLHAQRRQPALFGGPDGPLGRHYMGHISGKIADILFDDPATITDFDYFKEGGAAYVRRRLTISEDAQKREGLLNTAFWPDNPPFYDARHRSAVLSAVFLALAFKPLGRRLTSENIRRGHIGQAARPIAPHLRNIAVGAWELGVDMPAILRDRFSSRPRKPGFLARNRTGRYALHYHAEQIPHPDSRVRLGQESDAFGLPRLYIDYRFAEQDARSVVDAHRVLAEALREARIAQLEYRFPEQCLVDAVMDQATDGVHQIGTTRMGADPRSSVVDSSLKVHGLSNLYISSTSVMPTSGQANPTLTGVALTVRLAHHLSDAIAGRA
jgi:choline dehydrogenase-like flavoprotein